MSRCPGPGIHDRDDRADADRTDDVCATMIEDVRMDVVKRDARADSNTEPEPRLLSPSNLLPFSDGCDEGPKRGRGYVRAVALPELGDESSILVEAADDGEKHDAEEVDERHLRRREERGP